jgi:hypothetical protein
MTDQPSLRQRVARAIHRYDYDRMLSGNDMPSKHHYGEADFVLAELRAELAASGAVLPAADRAALRDHIAAAVQPLLMDTLPKPIAAVRADEIADAVLAVLPAPADRAAVLRDFLWRLEQSAGGAAAEKFLDDNPELRHMAVESAAVDRVAAEDDEGDELVCVDECGFCDACGMEPFGTPADGWREAARFLRRTARESGDRRGALHGARLIEAELRRLAEDAERRVAAETPPAETQRCANCGREIENRGDPDMGGNHEIRWVHVPGGYTICHPQQPNSPRATPGPAVEAQPEVPGHEWCKCRSCWGWFVEEHPGEDLDELGRDLRWWSGLPEHRDAPTGVGAQPGKDTETPQPKEA